MRDVDARADRARIVLSRSDLQALLDEFYDATKRGKTVQPRAEFLRSLQCPEPARRLWAQAIFEVVFAKPRMQSAFCERAEGRPAKNPAQDAWKSLTASPGHRMPPRVELNSALLPDAQAHNPEYVRFTAVPQLAFLLRFWPVASLFWQPVQLRWDNKKRRQDRKSIGKVLTVPDVRDLTGFCKEYRASLSRLDDATQLEVAIPEESALRFGQCLAAVARFLDGVEVWHLERVGNNVDIRGRYYVRWDPDIISDYDRLPYGHPLFRAGVVRGLLTGSGPHRLLAQRLMALPHEQFVAGPDRDQWTWQFGHDAWQWFREREADWQAEVMALAGDTECNAGVRARPLEVMVRDLVRQYVLRKTETRTRLSWDDYHNGRLEPDQAASFREKFQKVCEDLFLSVRGRRHREAFVAYLAETLGAVPQYLPDADLVALNSALQGDGWADVRALVLLAAAAVSSMVREDKNR
jgi:CRISPR-associated protein Cmx8